MFRSLASVAFDCGQAALEDLRGMLQLPEADCRQVHLDVVSPLLAQRLTAMVEKADFSREVRTPSSSSV